MMACAAGTSKNMTTSNPKKLTTSNGLGQLHLSTMLSFQRRAVLADGDEMAFQQRIIAVHANFRYDGSGLDADLAQVANSGAIALPSLGSSPAFGGTGFRPGTKRG